MAAKSEDPTAAPAILAAELPESHNECSDKLPEELRQAKRQKTCLAALKNYASFPVAGAEGKSEHADRGGGKFSFSFDTKNFASPETTPRFGSFNCAAVAVDPPLLAVVEVEDEKEIDGSIKEEAEGKVESDCELAADFVEVGDEREFDGSIKEEAEGKVESAADLVEEEREIDGSIKEKAEGKVESECGLAADLVVAEDGREIDGSIKEEVEGKVESHCGLAADLVEVEYESEIDGSIKEEAEGKVESNCGLATDLVEIVM